MKLHLGHLRIADNDKRLITEKRAVDKPMLFSSLQVDLNWIFKECLQTIER